MHLEKVSVTPAMALKWLEGNTHNRAVRDSVVARYASDMRLGRWRMTHQGIAFNGDGTLIDGQHRLYALIESGVKSVPMLVATGMSFDEQMVIDDHLKRSVVDVLKLEGLEMAQGLSNMHIAVVRRLSVPVTQMVIEAWGRQQTQAALLLHESVVNFALASMAKHMQNIWNAGVLAALARARYHESVETLTRFAEILVTGEQKLAREQAATLLRTWLLSRRGAGGSRASHEGFVKSLQAIKTFAAGERLGQLRMTTQDVYPLPKSKAVQS